MGNHDYGTSLLNGIDAVLNLLCGNGIQAGGGLIQEDNRRIFQEHTGNGDTLLLSTTELQGLRVKLLRKLHYLIINIRLFSGFHHLFMRCRRLAITNVFFNGTAENMVFLQHQTDILSQHLRIPFLQRHAVQRYRTTVRRIELIQEVNDGGLPRPT